MRGAAADVQLPVDKVDIIVSTIFRFDAFPSPFAIFPFSNISALQPDDISRSHDARID